MLASVQPVSDISLTRVHGLPGHAAHVMDVGTQLPRSCQIDRYVHAQHLRVSLLFCCADGLGIFLQNIKERFLVLLLSFFKARCFQSFITPLIFTHLGPWPPSQEILIKGLLQPFSSWDLKFKTSHYYATQLTHELNSNTPDLLPHSKPFHPNDFSPPRHQPPRKPGSSKLTCRSLAMDSLGMISLWLSLVMKQSAWYWLCPLSSSPRISARKIFTSWEEKHAVIVKLCHSLRHNVTL